MLDIPAMDLTAERAAAATLAQTQSAALRELAVPRGQAPAALSASTRAACATPPPSPTIVAPPTGEPGWWSVAGIAAAYRSGVATPASLIEALLERIARLDPQLNAFVHLDAEGARGGTRSGAAARVSVRRPGRDQGRRRRRRHADDLPFAAADRP
ncbi:hypothetical protein [Novosphingobium sp. Gsoil 351]|uniref:hypothetical protein n=1 Tax=Novosphingobium sp. Gsoil 351 TaxID=2675225 RepID=UPI001E5D1B0E|nr:hypothetical protein [Novosphingobium sp. Gsoil 351]